MKRALKCCLHDPNTWQIESQNRLSWKRPLKTIVQLPCNEQEHLQLDHVAQSLLVTESRSKHITVFPFLLGHFTKQEHVLSLFWTKSSGLQLCLIRYDWIVLEFITEFSKICILLHKNNKKDYWSEPAVQLCSLKPHNPALRMQEKEYIS